MNIVNGFLFSEQPLVAVIQNRTRELIKEIDSIPEHQLLEMDVEEFCTALIEKHRIEPIMLQTNAITTDRDVARIDVRNDPFRMINDRSKPVYAQGMSITIAIPFTGDPVILKSSPDQVSSMRPYAKSWPEPSTSAKY